MFGESEHRTGYDEHGFSGCRRTRRQVFAKKSRGFPPRREHKSDSKRQVENDLPNEAVVTFGSKTLWFKGLSQPEKKGILFGNVSNKGKHLHAFLGQQGTESFRVRIQEADEAFPEGDPNRHSQVLKPQVWLRKEEFIAWGRELEATGQDCLSRIISAIASGAGLRTLAQLTCAGWRAVPLEDALLERLTRSGTIHLTKRALSRILIEPPNHPPQALLGPGDSESRESLGMAVRLPLSKRELGMMLGRCLLAHGTEMDVLERLKRAGVTPVLLTGAKRILGWLIPQFGALPDHDSLYLVIERPLFDAIAYAGRQWMMSAAMKAFQDPAKREWLQRLEKSLDASSRGEDVDLKSFFDVDVGAEIRRRLGL